MTVGGAPDPLLPVDPFDARRSVAGTGLLGPFTEATVLDAADVHVALTLGRLAGGSTADVELAAALAVRAVRLGHVYVDLETVATTATQADEELDVDLTRLPWPDGAAWTRSLASSALTSVGVDGLPARPLRLIGSRLYLDRYWRHERAIIDDLLGRSTGSPPVIDGPTLTAGLAEVFGPRTGAAVGDTDDDLQRIAAATAVLRRFSVVAGGPGTGKTTTVARILALLHQQADALGQPPPHIGLAAPTGKAAARLEEAVHAEAAEMTVDPAIRAALLGVSASTLHRLLGWQPGNRSRFRHDATNHLPHSVVVVDESSMVSLSMMAKLLAAVRPSARLVLVGDPRQLASIEAGAVLGDIVGRAAGGLLLSDPARLAVETALGRPVAAGDPGDHPIADGTVVLRRIHRFGGAIAELAAKIEQGDADGVMAALRADAGPGAVRWIEPDGHLDPTAAPQLAGVRASVLGAARAVVAAAREGRAEEALAALRSVQILCSHRRGPFGANLWRGDIERWLRATIDGYGVGPWYAGRPLLVTENDYGLGVFNGDTGVVVDEGDGRLRAVFERRGEILRVRPTRLSSVDSLYAMTIHKSQGSQFDEVVVVLPESSPVLTRELLYTGVTRARDRVTVVATEAAVRAAVDRPVARASGLADSLWGG